MTDLPRISDSDWSFCKLALAHHSRTFALPISMLEAPLEQGVTAAYLLCRIADTIEDTPGSTVAERERLFRVLVDALEQDADESGFVHLSQNLPGLTSSEASLCAGLPRVLRVFRGTPGWDNAKVWIGELVRGMSIYGARLPGTDGVTALVSMADLDRYCYFVAGVIGHLLTDLFASNLSLDATQRAVLQTHAEAFGQGLQLVNILRDMSGDLQRHVCFVPRAELAAVGVEPRDLLRPEYARRVSQALVPVFALAETRLEQALEYVLSIPSHAKGIRCFCLVPLWLAVATLRQCQADPRLLVRGEKVKLTRAEVGELVQQCVALAQDDRAIRASFSELQAREPVVAA